MAKSQTVKAREGDVLDQDLITPGRFRELDGFRGLAAITVVIYHLGVPATENYPRTAPSPMTSPLASWVSSSFHHFWFHDSAQRHQERVGTEVRDFAFFSYLPDPIGLRWRYRLWCISSTETPDAILRFRRP